MIKSSLRPTPDPLLRDGLEEAALDRLLERQPRNLAALIQRGQAREAAGDERAASAFYKTALANAGAVPPQLRAEIERIQRWLGGTSGRFEAISVAIWPRQAMAISHAPSASPRRSI